MNDQNTAMGAKYRFVPYARHGYRPTDEFSEGSPDASAQPSIGIDVTPKGVPRDGAGMETASDREVSLSMYGPGDVQGFDDAQIVRVEPRPGSKDFQPNYFPFVEFDRPDLPWMFSPEKSSPKGRIRPWLSLITVEDTEDVTVSTGDGRPSPVLELGSGVDLGTELPDLSESWAWAHVQSHARPRGASGDWYGSGTKPTGWLYDELQKTSNITRSRLLCPRNLEESTDYLAAVVPTFEPGRRAALGEDPFGGDGRANAGEVALAWRKGDLPETPFEVPLFHYWRFKAGTAGTFEQLVDRLEPAELGPEVGRKEVDVREPGPESLEPTGNEPLTVEVGGAMYSAAAKRAVTGFSSNQPPKPYAQADRLRDLLNKPETLTWGSSGDAKFPVVGPPLYGQWHAGLEAIPDPGVADRDEYDPEWFRTLNQNVRHRVAAAVGTGIVQEYQEQLMEAAWGVVDEIREKNEIVKRTQESEVVGRAMESSRRVRGDDDSDFGTDEGGPIPDARNPNAVRREFERIRRIADLSAAGEIEGIDPETPAAGTDPLAPRDGEGDPSSQGLDRTQPTDPVDFLAVGGAVDGERAGFEGLALAYAGEGDVVGPGTGARTDGGGAVSTGTDQELTQTAVYVEYLRTFLSQPEASLQFQRMVRLGGPLAKRTGMTADDYRTAVERASRRAEREVEKLVEAATASPPTGDGMENQPATAPSEILPDSFRESGTGPPEATTPSPAGGSAGGTGEFGSSGLVDADTLATLGEGSRVEALATSQSADNTDPAEPTGGDNVGHEPLTRGSLRPATALPKVRTLETREESARALDARVPQMEGQSGAVLEGEDPETTLDLIDGIREHCTAVRDRIEAADDAREDAPGESTRRVLSAYESARPIAYSLDPLGRAVAKAVADPEVGTTEDLTDATAAETMLQLRESYRSLLSALTGAHEVVSETGRDDESRSSTGDRDGPGSAGGRPHSDGGGSTGSGASGPGGDEVMESLVAARDALGRVEGDLRELQGLFGFGGRRMPTTQALRTDGTTSVEPAYDPRNAGATTLSMDAIENRINFSGARGYARVNGGLQLPMVDTTEFVRDTDPVQTVMVAPEFPTPTWRLLKEKDPEFVLPGADSVPKHSVSLVFENREFVESYMVGLSHEVGRELLWRQYPTDRKGTYFQRFWNRGSGPAWESGSPFELGDAPTKDIDQIHEWNESGLGENGPDGTATEKLFLLVRGKLFEKFPDTVVYAARARVAYDEGGNPTVVPTTPEEYVKNADTSEQNVRFPMFRGKINEDVTFLAFDLSQSDVYADHGDVLGELYEDQQSWEYPDQEAPFGWYFVFEERPGETRFGLDEGATEDVGPDGTTHDWNDISWYHTVDEASELASTSYLSVEENEPSGDWSAGEEEWGRNGAHMAGITWQQPVRVSYHAHEMLADRDDDPSYVR